MHKNVMLLIAILYSGVTMAENMFIHSYNTVSERYAILDEFGNTGVLYLSEKGSQKPEKDALAYMQVSPIDEETWKEKMRAGEPPVLHIGIASKEAVIAITKENDFSFRWSNDGQAVALIYKGKAITFISLSEKYGFSKAVIKDTKIVKPWDQSLYEQLFN
jgi:hypothetical protein